MKRLNQDLRTSDVTDVTISRIDARLDALESAVTALIAVDVDFDARITALEAGGGGGGAGITQAVIDFGTTAVREKVFTIVDAGVVAPTYKVVVKMAYTGETSENPGVDETLLLAAQAGTGQFTLFARVASNDAVRGQFTINYQVAA